LLVYNKSGILAVTKDESLARSRTGLPMGFWRFDVVDRTDNVLIYSQNTGVGVLTPTQTLTPTPDEYRHAEHHNSDYDRRHHGDDGNPDYQCHGVSDNSCNNVPDVLVRDDIRDRTS
jgi:hypothetical protein